MVWYYLALAMFWIGLTWALFDRLSVPGLRQETDQESGLLNSWVRSLARVALLDLLAPIPVLFFGEPMFNPGVLSSILALLWLTSMLGSVLGDTLARLTGRWLKSLAIAAGTIVVMGLLSCPAWTLPGVGPVGRVIAGMVPTRWAFEALLDLSAADAMLDPANDPVERFYPAEADRMGPSACAAALLAMLGALVYLDAIIAHSGADRWRRVAPAWR